MLVQVFERACRTTTISLVFADGLEERHGDETARVGEQRVAGLVPVRIVFSAYDMEKVALGKGQFLSVFRAGVVIVEGFDDLGYVTRKERKRLVGTICHEV